MAPYTTVMKALARLESFIQDLVERPAWLLSSRRLHPLEMAAALTRALETAALPLADRVLAPDAYIIQLHPGDFEQFSGVRATLEREFAGYMTRLAAERGVTMNVPASVALVEQSGVRPGTVSVLTRFTEERQRSAASTYAPSAGRDGRTGPGLTERVAPRRGPPTTAAAGEPSVEVLGPDDAVLRRFMIRDPRVVIGRRATSGLALSDAEVSRQHAVIEYDAPRYYLRDLESTNGTCVNGRRLTSRYALADGDVIEVGRTRLRFRSGG